MQIFFKATKLVSLILLFQSNCGGQPSQSNSVIDRQNPDSDRKQALLTCDSSTSALLEDRAVQARSEIEAVLNAIPTTCSEESVPQNERCKKVTVHFEPKNGKDISRGQRILVMDAGFHIPAMTRYKSRVLDFLEFGDGGQLASTKGTLLVNKAFYELTSEILDEKYSGLPSVLLGDSLASLNSKIKKENRVLGYDNFGHHGTFIFTKLAEYNPKSEFVLIDDSNFAQMDQTSGFDLCSIQGSEKDILKKHAEYSQFVSNQIKKLVEKHEINFINFSFSPSLKDYQRKFKSKCGRILASSLAVKLLKNDLKYFFEPIYSIPNVISVQAILNQGDFSTESEREKNLIDCTKMPNRFRIGAYSALESNIPVEGSSSTQVFAPDRRTTSSCMDLAVNMGLNWDWSEDYQPVLPKCFVHFFSKGLGRAEPPSESMLSSSYAAPIALSYLIYLKNTLAPGTSIEEIKKIATGGGVNFIKDPIRHRQIEIYRLGHLDP